MPLIQFPDVPNVPGVPPLLRAPVTFSASASASISLGGIQISAGISIGTQPPGTPGGGTWGVFFMDDGTPALEPDSIKAFDFHNSDRVSNAPQEAGAFMSYNKVEQPAEARFEMIVGTDLPTRAAMLASLEPLKQSVAPLMIVTPEIVYSNYTLTHYGYRREARNGVSLIVIDAWFEEIRQGAASGAPAAQVDNPQSVSGNDPVDNGQLTPAAPDATTDAQFQPADAL